MSLMHVRATFRCDGCGRAFMFEITPDTKLPADWTLFEEAEDCLRGGSFLAYVGEKRSGRREHLFSSLQSGHHLCPDCTSRIDEAVPEDRDATEAEIEEILSSNRFESTQAVQGEDEED